MKGKILSTAVAVFRDERVNTLDNRDHKTPTQSKRKRTGKKRLKGHGPEHVYNALGYTWNADIEVCMR